MSSEIIRLFVSDKQLMEIRERLIALLAKHVVKDHDLTLMEAILMKDLLEIGIKEVKTISVQKDSE